MTELEALKDLVQSLDAIRYELGTNYPALSVAYLHAHEVLDRIQREKQPATELLDQMSSWHWDSPIPPEIFRRVRQLLQLHHRKVDSHGVESCSECGLNWPCESRCILDGITYRW